MVQVNWCAIINTGGSSSSGGGGECASKKGHLIIITQHQASELSTLFSTYNQFQKGGPQSLSLLYLYCP